MTLARTRSSYFSSVASRTIRTAAWLKSSRLFFLAAGLGCFGFASFLAFSVHCFSRSRIFLFFMELACHTESPAASPVEIQTAPLPHREGFFAVLAFSELQRPHQSLDHNVIHRFQQAALCLGFLFRPQQSLTQREDRPGEGLPPCHYCRIALSCENGSLGCTQCKYYACICGRCLCGYEGRNYRGEFFKQHSSLPISREQRLECVRVARWEERQTRVYRLPVLPRQSHEPLKISVRLFQQ